jgi:hypothetical protein
MADKVIIERRLCLTEDKSRVVDENDPDARWLWAIPGHVVDRAEAERLGAVKADPDPEAEPPKRKPGRPPGSGTKKATPAEDKSVTPEENKGGLSIQSRPRRV